MGPLPALLAAAIILPVAAAAGIEAFADHSTVTVTNAGGSSVPGCEETNECFIPHVITVTVGSNVIWTNSDNAAHTVTSGVLSEGGPDGLFDSGLFSPGAEFSHTFTEAGRHPYFCLVHPWMEGAVLVVRGTDGVTDHGGTAVYEPETIEPSAVGRMSDGTIVEVRAAEPAAGEPMNINVAFVDSEHVNYDILVMQGDTVLLNQKGAHFHGGVGDHRTPPLKSGDPVYIDITFQGFGVATITGPVGYHVAFVQMMPWPGPEMSGMVDLAGEDLSYADLRGADLAWADLRGADLSYAYLQNANLYGADLAWADLRGADLSYADLRGANLSYAYLQSANLYGANLAGADLAWADLTRAFLWEADFSDAGHAYFGGAHLRFADFTAANLAGANLAGADLAWANLRGANLEMANLTGADLAEASLYGAYLAYADLSHADLSHADLRWSAPETEIKGVFDIHASIYHQIQGAHKHALLTDTIKGAGTANFTGTIVCKGASLPAATQVPCP